MFVLISVVNYNQTNIQNSTGGWTRSRPWWY